MSQFLTRILETKQAEVEELRRRPVDRALLSALPPCRGFARSVVASERLAVVAEVKKASPSKGLIAETFHPIEIAQNYERAGAAAISVLTDRLYFQGSMEDLQQVRGKVSIPVLRKDFIIDESQIDEARLFGADAVLLICAALDQERLRELSLYAQSLGLDVLIEVHAVAEVEAAMHAKPSILGVNNRDLRTFEVSLQTTQSVIQSIPSSVPVISESGIFTAQDAETMARYGAVGVLVGESLMRLGPSAQAETLLRSLRVPRGSRGANTQTTPSNVVSET